MIRMVPDLPEPDHWPVSLDFPGVVPLDDAAFDVFCQSRPDLRNELDRDGNLIVRHPVEPVSGNKELRLGMLIDPREQNARIYRSGQSSPELLSRPEQLAGDPEMPGLIFDLGKVW